MSLQAISRATLKAFRDVDRNHLFAFAGSLAYYLFFSLIPLLIFLASVLAYIPIPNLFDQILTLMSYVVPRDSMLLVRKVLGDIMATRNTGFLSFGILGTIWAASGAFSAMIEALNVAYDVREGRPYWHTRSLAVGLTFLVGAVVFIMLSAMILGPRFANWLGTEVGIDPLMIAAWLYFRWVLATGFTVLAVEIIYYLAPNVEQRKFWRTVPGAFIAVCLWIAASYGLGIYLQHFARFSKTYGSLGAVAALLLWFYISGAAILIGAEINAELLKAARDSLPVKAVPSSIERPSGPLPLAG